MEIDASVVGLYTSVLGAVRLIIWYALHNAPHITISSADNVRFQRVLDDIVNVLFDPTIQYILLGHCIFQLVSGLFLINGAAKKKKLHFWPFFIHMWSEFVIYVVLNGRVTGMVCFALNPTMFSRDSSADRIIFEFLCYVLAYFILATPFFFYYNGLRKIVKVDYKKACQKPRIQNNQAEMQQPIFVV